MTNSLNPEIGDVLRYEVRARFDDRATALEVAADFAGSCINSHGFAEVNVVPVYEELNETTTEESVENVEIAEQPEPRELKVNGRVIEWERMNGHLVNFGNSFITEQGFKEALTESETDAIAVSRLWNNLCRGLGVALHNNNPKQRRRYGLPDNWQYGIAYSMTRATLLDGTQLPVLVPELIKVDLISKLRSGELLVAHVKEGSISRLERNVDRLMSAATELDLDEAIIPDIYEDHSLTFS